MFMSSTTGNFCWMDLAATDADSAQAFYGRLFGWMPREHLANGGRFTRLTLGGRDVGSMYQLSRMLLDKGVPSHWTPYIKVEDVDAAAQHAAALGGKVLINPFTLADVARVALVLDPVGAHFGLWQPVVERRGH